jgi:pyruvate/2-oxoglutarate dehydrogenase complex dihydrolipoamide acyltransferase (E2) component
MSGEEGDDESKTQEEELDRSKYTEEILVRMPDMGEGEGKILKWYKQEGDIVRRGDILCDIETPDFSFGMELDDEHPGILGKIVVEAPSDPIKDEEVICILLHKSKDEEPKQDEEQ